MEFWDGDEPDTRTLTGFGSPVNVVSVARNKSGFSEMALADFVTFRTKKSSKAQDIDFEVLPPVRSVIALDDSGHDIRLMNLGSSSLLPPGRPLGRACRTLRPLL
jgi:hypothetical protein